MLSGLSGARCSAVACQQSPGSRKPEGVLIISFATLTSPTPQTLASALRATHEGLCGGLQDSRVLDLARLTCCVTRPGHYPSLSRGLLTKANQTLSICCMPSAVSRIVGIMRPVRHIPALEIGVGPRHFCEGLSRVPTCRDLGGTKVEKLL